MRSSPVFIKISNWSQSSGKAWNSKPSGMPSMPHGLAFGSKPPRISLNLFLYVDIAVHIAQDGLIVHDAFHGSGYDVVMLRGMQRNVDAKRRTEIACPHAGANNDDVGLDASLVGLGTESRDRSRSKSRTPSSFR